MVCSIYVGFYVFSTLCNHSPGNSHSLWHTWGAYASTDVETCSAAGCTAEWMAQWEQADLPCSPQTGASQGSWLHGRRWDFFFFWVLGLASSSRVLIIFKLKKKSSNIFVIGDFLLTNLKMSCNKMLLINFTLTDFCLNIWETELFWFIIAFLNSYRAGHIDFFLQMTLYRLFHLISSH